MSSGIYKILNCATGKFYIGSAVNFARRWKNHSIELRLDRHCNPHLQSAYNKYGLHNFEFIVLEEVSNKADLLKREQHWLDLTRCFDREIGYNIQPVAGSNLGLKASPETRALLSAKRKGKPRTEAEKLAIKEGWKKRGPVSNETKLRQSLAHIGQTKSEEFKLGASERWRGNKINLGRKQSPEEIEVRRKANTGKKRTPEQIARVLFAQKRAFAIRSKNLMWTW